MPWSCVTLLIESIAHCPFNSEWKIIVREHRLVGWLAGMLFRVYRIFLPISLFRLHNVNDRKAKGNDKANKQKHAAQMENYQHPFQSALSFYLSHCYTSFLLLRMIKSYVLLLLWVFASTVYFVSFQYFGIQMVFFELKVFFHKHFFDRIHFIYTFIYRKTDIQMWHVCVWMRAKIYFWHTSISSLQKKIVTFDFKPSIMWLAIQSHLT